MSQLEDLRGFVTERLTAASQEILAAVDRVVAGYEAEASGFREEIERQRNLLDVLLQPRVVLNKTADVQHLSRSKEELPQNWSSSLVQEDPESPHIKKEQEDLGLSQEGEQLLEVLFTPVQVKSEYEEEKPQSLQPHQRQTEAGPPSSSSAEQIETDGDDYGGSEPARNLDQPDDFQPDADDEDSKLSSEAEDSDVDLRETKAPESGVSDESHSCSECGKTFYRESDLKRHMGIHTEEKPFFCDVCGKRFQRKRDLTTHINVHTNQKTFGCKVCGKLFYRQDHLTGHMAVHSGDRPHACDFCGKTYKRRGELTIHMRVHTGEKPFGCSVCGKKFHRHWLFKVHMRSHTGEKAYSCAFCGKQFTTWYNCNKHMKACEHKYVSEGSGSK